MEFLAVVRYPDGRRIIKAFRSPLERAHVVQHLKNTEPGVKIKLKQARDHDDLPPEGEGQWYEPKGAQSTNE